MTQCQRTSGPRSCAGNLAPRFQRHGPRLRIDPSWRSSYSDRRGVGWSQDQANAPAPKEDKGGAGAGGGGGGGVAAAACWAANAAINPVSLVNRHDSLPTLVLLALAERRSNHARMPRQDCIWRPTCALEKCLGLHKRTNQPRPSTTTRPMHARFIFIQQQLPVRFEPRDPRYES